MAYDPDEDRHSLDDYFSAVEKLSVRHPVSVAHLTWKIWGGSRVKTHGFLVGVALNQLVKQGRVRRTQDGLYEPSTAPPREAPVRRGRAPREATLRKWAAPAEPAPAEPALDPEPEPRKQVQQSEVGDAARDGAALMATRGDALAEVAWMMDRIPDLLARLEAEAKRNNERHDQLRAAHQALTVARDTFQIWSR